LIFRSRHPDVVIPAVPLHHLVHEHAMVRRDGCGTMYEDVFINTSSGRATTVAT
jgi:hypothetical protein